MKILTGHSIREADRITASNRGISGIELMEEASLGLADNIRKFLIGSSLRKPSGELPLLFIIGKGNNGGDGLAVARMLHLDGIPCEVVLTCPPEEMSQETAFNLNVLPHEIRVWTIDKRIEACENIAHQGQWTVDALLGTGIKGKVRSRAEDIIRRLNSSGAETIAIDLPSGLPTEPEDTAGKDGEPVRAKVTLTVGFPKLSLLLPETGQYAGKTVVSPLNLDKDFLAADASPYSYTEASDVKSLLRPRSEYAHKGEFGHALLVCGSENMLGAAILSTLGALRSGCGLVTTHLPASERAALYSRCPSAMTSPDPSGHLSVLPAHIERFTAIGTGCGLGQNGESYQVLRKLMAFGKPMVLDADALNFISIHPQMLDSIPEGSILTPHLGEFRRLAGEWNGPADRLSKAIALASRISSCIVLKGAHTAVIAPDGSCAFNSTGNPGMAKGGSGDVLTGLLTGLLASGYSAFDAARLGVWIHGKAGDIAADRHGREAMNSLDIAESLSEAYSLI